MKKFINQSPILYPLYLILFLKKRRDYRQLRNLLYRKSKNIDQRI